MKGSASKLSELRTLTGGLSDECPISPTVAFEYTHSNKGGVVSLTPESNTEKESSLSPDLLEYLKLVKTAAKEIIRTCEEAIDHEDSWPSLKHQLEESVEQHKMEIQELKEKIENMRNFGDIANNLFEDKKLQKALLQAMVKNGFGKQLMELTGK